MAKSDIILNDDHVLVKGELKVDSISVVRIPDPSIREPAITLNQAEIVMLARDGRSRTLTIKREGSLYVGGYGSIKATDLHLSGRANIEKIDSSQISLGGSGGGENPQNGKITMLNTRGQVVLTIDAQNAAQIVVPGLGDLIGLIKKLEQRVTLLERKRP
jgi:hypothetical protein